MKNFIVRLICICSLLFICTEIVQAGNSFSISSDTFEAGTVQTLNIDLTNTESITAFQFRIKLPDGFTIAKTINEDNEEVEDITLTGRKKSTHGLSFKKKADGSYAVAVFSTSNAVFSGNEGALVAIKVKVSSSMKSGDYDIEMSDIVIVAPDETTTRQPAFSTTVKVNNVSGGGTETAQLSLASATLSAGTDATLSFNLDNTLPVTALQFDVTLPEGLSVNTMRNEDNEEVLAITLAGRQKSSHSLSCNKREDGRYTIVILSMKNQAFSGEEGAIVNMSVSVSSTLPTGSYSVAVSRVVISPLVNGEPGISIMQPDFTSSVTVNNMSGDTDSAQLSLVAGSLKAGEEHTISLDLVNGIEVTAMQFDVKFPDGITLCTMKNEDGEEVPAITLTGRKKSSHSLSCNKREDGSYTVVILSMKNQAFSGTSGALVDMRLAVASTVQTGSYDLSVKNIVISPLVNGKPGISVRQPDFTDRLYVENSGGGGDITGSVALSISPLTLAPGAEGICNINMMNDRDICAFEFKFKLPEGVSVVEEYNDDDEWGASIQLTDRKKSSHQLSFQKKEDGSYRVVVFSLQNATFKDKSGAVVAIKVKVDPDMKRGDYGIVLSEAILITPSEEKITQEDTSFTISITGDVGVENELDNQIICTSLEGFYLVNGTLVGDVVEIFDVNGRKIYSKSSTGEQLLINKTELPEIVILRVTRDGKQVYVKKMIHG